MALGCITLVAWLSISALSHQFVFGHDHPERPIGAYLGYYSLAWLAFAGAWYLAVRQRTRPGAFWIVLLVGLLARCFLLPSSLVQENDCYRYVLDGQALCHRVNPYAYSPEAVNAEAPPFFQHALGQDEARRVLSRISYPEIPTIYPPLSQFAFAGGAALTGWDWFGQRLVFLGFDVATLATLGLGLHLARLPLLWIVMYAWNPLVIKEIANSAHSDSLAAFFVAVMTVVAAVAVHRRGWLRYVLVSLALTAAVLARFYPILLAPLAAVFVWRRTRSWRLLFVCAGVSVAFVVAAYWPFVDVGLAQLTAGLRAYGGEWVRNEGVFGVFAAILSDDIARAAAAGVTAATALGAAWWYGRGAPDFSRFIAAAQFTLVTWLLLTPASFPWYAVVLIALSVYRPQPWVVVLTGACGLYYLLFLIEYRGLPDSYATAVKSLEHGLIWASLLLAWQAARRKESEISPTSP